MGLENKTYYSYETEFGNMIIVSDGNVINAVYIENYKVTEAKKLAGKLTDKAAKQLEEYFAGKRRHFDLPLQPNGTAFQQSAWNALISIPYGETRSYKQVAQMIGNPDASRAVGMANNRNPIMIIIPCHRVIGADGALAGYGGGLTMKQRLLELESRK